jgi:hypothetical protein
MNERGLRGFHAHFTFNSAPDGVFRGLQVESRLQIHPELSGGSKSATQAKRRVCSDRPPALDDLADPLGRHFDVLCESILRDAKRIEKLHLEDRSGVDRRQSTLSCLCVHRRSVIIDHFHVIGMTDSPHKADSPLIIDANAVLSCTIAPELLEAVARRHSKVCQRRGGVKHDEFLSSTSLHAARPAPHGLAAEQPLRVPASKRGDHAPDNSAMRYACQMLTLNAAGRRRAWKW